MKLFLKVQLLSLVAFVLCSNWAWANYEADIQDQAQRLSAQHAKYYTKDYFRDMGLIARKATDAQFIELTSQLIRHDLIDAASLYVNQQLEEISGMFRTDGVAAARKLQDLIAYQRFYQPSEFFLKTAEGKSIVDELIDVREAALKTFDKGCSRKAIEQGVEALIKTGVFETLSFEENKSMRIIKEQVVCCTGWAPEVRVSNTSQFESPYDSGTVTEEATLELSTSARKLDQAKWSGDWLFKVKAREGRGSGKSNSEIRVNRGDYRAEVYISSTQMDSVGRIFMPKMFSGEVRYYDMEGDPIFPVIDVPRFKKIQIVGCRE